MSWRQCPFLKGEQYLVKKDFSKLSERFAQGQLLEFLEKGYSRCDNLTIYSFKDVGNGATLSLEVTDAERPEDWAVNFEHQL